MDQPISSEIAEPQGPNTDQPISSEIAEQQNLNLDSSSHIEMLDQVSAKDGRQIAEPQNLNLASSSHIEMSDQVSAEYGRQIAEPQNLNLASSSHINQGSAEDGLQIKVDLMDDELYKLVYRGDIATLQIKYSATQLQPQRTPKNNSVLHIAAQYGKVDCVKWILRLPLGSSLLQLPNLKGDTPLHLAAREGYDDVVQALFDFAVDSKEVENGIGTDQVLLTMANKEKDTALHEAVRYNHPKIVELLIEQDPEFPYGANITGHTPLYMAAEMGYGDLVQMILYKSHTSPTYTGIMGRTALHAAVIRNDKEMIDKILNWNKDLTKIVDENGWSPLHCAAYLGYTDIVKQIIRRRSNKSVIYLQINNGKKTALHIAATGGHLGIVKELLLTSPACSEQVDDTGKNVFHFAMMKKDNIYAGRFLEDLDDCVSLRGLINEKDFQGNTPLHLLATYQLSDGSFISDSKVDKMAFNKENLTAKDILSSAKDIAGEKEPALREFARAKAINGPQAWKHVTKGDSGTRENEASDDKYVSEMKRRGEIHLIVAALIATVTFAAGFTLPGGYNDNEGAGTGLAILIRRAAFKVFVVSDTIAMVLSTSAVCVYFFMQLHEKKEALYKHLSRGFFLTMFAMGAMMVAFMTGVYAVLPHLSWLAIVTILLGCSFFIFFYYVFKKLIFYKRPD